MVDLTEQAKSGPVFTRSARLLHAKDYDRPSNFQNLHHQYPAGSVSAKRGSHWRGALFEKDFPPPRSFSGARAVPALREQALLRSGVLQGTQQAGRPIRILEADWPEIRTAPQANGAVTLAELYQKKKDAAKVLDLTTSCMHGCAVDNGCAQRADREARRRTRGEKLYPQALAASGGAHARAGDRIPKRPHRGDGRRMQANLDAARDNPQAVTAATGANNEIKAKQDERKRCSRSQKLPITAGDLFPRGEGRVRLGQKVETIVAFDRLLTEYPQGAEREQALYSTLVATRI